MERKPTRRPVRTTRRYYSRNKPQDTPDTTRLGNQLSISVLLCVFFIAIACIGSSGTEKLRSKASELIGKNSLENFSADGSIRENITEFVKCMFSYEEVPEEEITKDMQNENAGTAAQPDTASKTNKPAETNNSSSESVPPE